MIEINVNTLGGIHEGGILDEFTHEGVYVGGYI